MHIEYYGLRRVNPYFGVIQVIDAGAVRAYSTDGCAWQARRVYDAERFWSESEPPPGVPPMDEVSARDLQRAIGTHPPLPFPLGDRYELWLLRKDGGLPLALLKTCRWERDIETVRDPAWRAFLPGERGFNRRRPVGGGAMGGDHDQDRLQTLVNYAARPLPAAQWFERREDGSGIGRGGLRVTPDLEGRHLPAAAFPELLVDEMWSDASDRDLVREFHAWNGALLLAHHGLHPDTRRRLERAAGRYPRRLLDSYPHIPEVIDREALQVAVVTARLMNTV